VSSGTGSDTHAAIASDVAALLCTSAHEDVHPLTVTAATVTAVSHAGPKLS
jgi:hypothetical protein